MVEACIWYFHEKKIGKLECSYPLSETNQRPEWRREGASSTIYYKVSSALCCQESCAEKKTHIVSMEPKQRAHRINLTLSPYTQNTYFFSAFTFLTSLSCRHFSFALPSFTFNNKIFLWSRNNMLRYLFLDKIGFHGTDVHFMSYVRSVHSF